MILLGFNGCGYKTSPYYIENRSASDENVEFILKTPSKENNNTIDNNVTVKSVDVNITVESTNDSV